MSIQYYRTEKGRQELIDRSIRLNARQRALLLMIESEEASNTLLRIQIERLATPENLAQLVEHGLIESIGGALPEPDVVTQLAVPATASNEPDFAAVSVQAAPAEPAAVVQPAPVAPAAVVQPAPVVPAAVVQPAPVAPATVVQPVSVQPAAVIPPQPAVQTVPVVAVVVEPVAVVSETVVQPPVLTARIVERVPAPEKLEAVEVPDVALSFEEVKMMMVASLRRYCGLLAAPLIRDIEKAATAGHLRMCQIRWVTLLTESRAGAHNIAMWKEQINENLKNLG